MSTKEELINSEEFEAALSEGAEYKKEIATTYKRQNKTTYERFYQTMLDSREDIQKILESRRKDRTDADKELVKQFKQDTAKTYRFVVDFLKKEKVEEGKMTKIEKLVDKIATTLDLLRYIDSDVLDKEFSKRGIVLTSQVEFPTFFESDDIKNNVKDIFDCAVNLRQKVEDDNEHINTGIFTTKVPIELQFDKNTNNTGLKLGDFRKLVDMKTKLIMATTDEAKEKVDEKIEKAASDKQFEMARAELVRDKLVKF